MADTFVLTQVILMFCSLKFLLGDFVFARARNSGG